MVSEKYCIAKSVLLYVLLLFGYFGSCFSLTNTIDYDLDSFCTSLTDFYNHDYYDFESPILKLKQRDAKNGFKEYQAGFSYLEYNNFVNQYRFISDEKEVGLLDGMNIPLSLITQPTVFAQPAQDGLFKLDYGRYYTYFDTAFRGNQFIFITDTLAEKICEQRNIDLGQLLNTPIIFPSIEKTFYITNIIHSKKGYAENLMNLYGEFAMISSYEIINFNYHYEYGMKLNPYGNKETLKVVKDLFPPENFDYSIYKYDYEKGRLELHASSGERLTEILSGQYSVVFYLIPIMVVASFLAIFAFLKPDRNTHTLLATLVYFLFEGIVANFVYLYPYFTLVLLMFMAACAFAERRYIYAFFGKIAGKLSGKIRAKKFKI